MAVVNEAETSVQHVRVFRSYTPSDAEFDTFTERGILLTVQEVKEAVLHDVATVLDLIPPGASLRFVLIVGKE